VKRRSQALLVVLAPLSAACRESSGPPPWFAEEAHARGLVFAHASGHATEFWMPEIMGGGAALIDLEPDGDLDVYLVQGGSLADGAPPAALANALFENDGRGTFRDVSAASGATDPRYGMGATAGDLDGDGDTDLFVTNVGRNTLLLNQGGARFLDESEARGFGAALGWSTSAAAFDADRDGDLDLFACRYLEWARDGELVCTSQRGRDYCSPKSYKAPARSLFYANGGGGVFTDASLASGVASEPGTGLGVAVGDLDQDGWLDVFVASDGRANQLWRNLEGARFENVAMLAGCGVDAGGVPKAGMGVVLADEDGDLDLDVLVVNLDGENDSLYRNEGGFFSDRTPATGLAALTKPFTRFGLALGDLDHDGDDELYVANGRVELPNEPWLARDPYAEPDLLLARDATGRFAEVLPRGGTRALALATSRAVAQGDLDGDGALDLVVVDRDGPARLLVNRVAPRGRWALLSVLERNGADALGAVLELELAGRRLRRDVRVAFGYLASHDPRVHLGLGTAERVDTVLVTWVDGTRERFGPLAADHVHVLRRGKGVPP
jgi:hypothetical protein